MTITTYVNNVTTRQNLSGKISPTENYYLVNGEKKTPEEVDLLYPIDCIPQPTNTRYKGENSNKSVNWMVDKKSY